MISEIQPRQNLDQQLTDLESELGTVRAELMAAEANLAEYQAEVNAFRMHCRLKLDAWIERLMKVQTERQRLRTQLALLRQGAISGAEYNEEDPFWQSEELTEGELMEDDEEELLLPTETPRDKSAEQRLYRQLARKYHPDLAQTAVEIAYRTEMMAAVNTAYDQRDVQTLYDLADQLDPQHRAELAGIERFDVRKLRTEIIRLRQRMRKSRRRLATLREENSARLWQKAQLLDADDIHWWEIVRREIEQAIQRLESDINLHEQATAALKLPENPSE
jgi:hypothetical protein